jgi:hypothetical protein
MCLPLDWARAERNTACGYFAVLDLHGRDIPAVPNCQSNLDFHETLLGFKKLKSSPSKNFGARPSHAIAVTLMPHTLGWDPCNERT